MTRALPTVIVCVLILSGCSHTKTDVRSITEPTEPVRRVVVLPFNDDRVPTEVRDDASIGHTGEAEAGARVSNVLAQALMRQDVYEVLHGRELAVESRRREIHIDELREQPLLKIAELLDAEAVIVGDIFDMRQGWLLVASYDKMRFRARCVDAGTGTTIWEAEARGRSWFNMERDHAVVASDRIAERLARGEVVQGPLPLPLEDRRVKRHELLGDTYVPVMPEADRAELPFRSRRPFRP